MQLPAHAKGAGIEHHVRIGTVDRVANVVLAQLAQVFTLGRSSCRAVLEDEMRDQHRADQRHRRAGVELVVQALAERVLLKLGGG